MPPQPEPHRFGAFVHVAAGTQIQIFAMIDHRQIERARQFHRAAHHAGVHHRPAVVRDRDDAGLAHGTDGGKFLAEAALRDRADREHIDAGHFARALHDVAGNSRAVVHRQRVRHAADGW